jgi:hypothetical protein
MTGCHKCFRFGHHFRTLCVLVTVVAVPKLTRKLLIISDRGVLLAGTLVFSIEALVVILLRPMGYQSSFILDSLAFAALLVAFGYVAVRIILGDERRLQSIENGLAIAREIQTSIILSRQGVLRQVICSPPTLLRVDTTASASLPSGLEPITPEIPVTNASTLANLPANVCCPNPNTTIRSVPSNRLPVLKIFCREGSIREIAPPVV